MRKSKKNVFSWGLMSKVWEGVVWAETEAATEFDDCQHAEGGNSWQGSGMKTVELEQN